MREALRDLLRCPTCGGDLTLTSWAQDGEHIMEGVFVCQGDNGHWFPVRGGIPRMLAPEHRYEDEQDITWGKLHVNDLLAAGAAPNSVPTEADLLQLQQHTIRNFGFEWRTYDRFGWDDDTYDLDYTYAAFKKKAMLSDAQLTAGQLVLDAGCGNGRYAYAASQNGAAVIGMDLGHGVEPAFANTRDLPNVHICQADIFHPPFAPGTFDAAFSIGVLMHTGDARRATHTLARYVKPGGSLTVHLYGKGNPIYEFNDAWLRRLTTRMSIQRLMGFAERVSRFSAFLDRINQRRFVDRFFRVESHPHCMFDWYAAPIATHHTYPEVHGWFQEIGWQVAESGPQPKRKGLNRVLWRGRTVTVRGKRAAD